MKWRKRIALYIVPVVAISVVSWFLKAKGKKMKEKKRFENQRRRTTRRLENRHRVGRTKLQLQIKRRRWKSKPRTTTSQIEQPPTLNVVTPFLRS